MEDESRGTTARTRIVTVHLDDQTTILVEARDLQGEADVADRLQHFDKVASAIEKVTGALTKAWEKAGPSRASVELNLEFAWEAGELLAMFVQGSSSTGLKIKLEWEKSGH
jgi:hypothetical protein